MSEQGGGQPSVERRVEELEEYCDGDELTLEGLQEKIAGIPADAVGDLDFFHRACINEKVTLEMVKCLLGAFPQSLRVHNGDGRLPIHVACFEGTSVETVKYMLERYPESIDTRDDGDLPIHCAARSDGRSVEQGKGEIIRFLLTQYPDCASKTGAIQRLPLHVVACHHNCIDLARFLFDAYPEALNIEDEDGETPVDLARERGNDALVQFLEAQLAYVRLAEGAKHNAWLLFHALQNGATLGAIKLLIAGNRDALQVSDNLLAFPLHIACGFSSVGVVEYLLGLSDNHLHTLDLESDSTLHYACRGGNVGVVKCLLGRGAPSVSEPNDSGKLPIHLLCESDLVDRDSVKYVDAVWHLLLAHPETVMHCQGTSPN